LISFYEDHVTLDYSKGKKPKQSQTFLQLKARALDSAALRTISLKITPQHLALV